MLNRVYAIPAYANLETLTDALIREDGPGCAALLENWTGLAVRALLLFGSRSRGEGRPTSDVDAVAFVDTAELPATLRHGWRSARLDLEFVPSSTLTHPTSANVYWLPGRVLVDRSGEAKSMLAWLRDIRAGDPDPMYDAECRRWQIWTERMLARIAENLGRRDDLSQVLAQHQMNWLEQELLGIYPGLTGQWSTAPRALFEHMQRSRPDLWTTMLELSSAAPASYPRMHSLARLRQQVFQPWDGEGQCP